MADRLEEIRQRLAGKPPAQWWSQAQAREDVAHLLAEVERLTARVRVLTEALEQYLIAADNNGSVWRGDLAGLRAALAGTGAPPAEEADE